MKIEDIEIHTGKPSRDFKSIGPIKAKVGAATVFSKTPTMEDVNQKLREQAAQMGANAIIDIKYDRGVSMSSWKALTATGTAVILTAEDKKEQVGGIEGKLEALNALKEKNLITEDEYRSKRSDIIQSL
jgi:hypothetical protein